MTGSRFDDLDRGLVHAPHIDGRAPFNRIAAVLDVSARTVARRWCGAKPARISSPATTAAQLRPGRREMCPPISGRTRSPVPVMAGRVPVRSRVGRFGARFSGSRRTGRGRRARAGRCPGTPHARTSRTARRA
ncbi:AsnC family protein [Streptomyces sp. NPDC101776]|uniref:AsnC family protein n=1 Tax=Streptomyces sp. NPDC101776 TaxID=3366146 RepID=UPI0038027CC2